MEQCSQLYGFTARAVLAVSVQMPSKPRLGCLAFGFPRCSCWKPGDVVGFVNSTEVRFVGAVLELTMDPHEQENTLVGLHVGNPSVGQHNQALNPTSTAILTLLHSGIIGCCPVVEFQLYRTPTYEKKTNYQRQAETFRDTT